jgi:hypothetical protein
LCLFVFINPRNRKGREDFFYQLNPLLTKSSKE